MASMKQTGELKDLLGGPTLFAVDDMKIFKPLLKVLSLCLRMYNASCEQWAEYIQLSYVSKFENRLTNVEVFAGFSSKTNATSFPLQRVNNEQWRMPYL